MSSLIQPSEDVWQLAIVLRRYGLKEAEIVHGRSAERTKN